MENGGIIPKVLRFVENTGMHKDHQTFLAEQIQVYLESHLDQQITNKILEEQFHMHCNYLARIMKNVYGKTPLELLMEMRMNYAKEYLIRTDYDITKISKLVGFDSEIYFSNSFKKYMGLSPRNYRKKYERTKLNSFRMIGGNVGYFITATFTLTLVSLLGRGNRQHGFFFTVLIYALVSIAMLSDTVDYGEYKNHVRASGFLTAVGSAVGLQVGTGLGDFTPLKLMQHFGYVANQEQSAGSLAAMKFGFSYLQPYFS